MFKFLKNREAVFMLVSLFLLAGLGAVLIYSLNFLIKNLGQASLENPSANQRMIKFNFQKLEELRVEKSGV